MERTYFCGRVYIFYREDGAKAVEEDLGEGGDQLGSGDQDVDTVGSGGY